MDSESFYTITSRMDNKYLIERYKLIQPTIVNGVSHKTFERVSLCSVQNSELSDYLTNCVMYPIVMNQANPSNVNFDTVKKVIHEKLETEWLGSTITKTIEIKFSELQGTVELIQ